MGVGCGEEIGVGVTVGVEVAVGSGVFVGVGEGVFDGVELGVGEGEGVKVGVGEAIGNCSVDDELFWGWEKVLTIKSLELLSVSSPFPKNSSAPPVSILD